MNVTQQDWSNRVVYTSIPNDTKIFEKVQIGQVKIMILIAPAWKGQPWYPELLSLSKQLPFCKSPVDQVHPNFNFRL